MTREELDFIGAMNMCDEISNEAYKKIVCHCEGQEPCPNTVSRSDMLDAIGHGMSYTSEDLQKIIKALPPVNPQPYEDAISRQAVLEYIELSDAELGHSSENKSVCQDIKEFPPVTPAAYIAKVAFDKDELQKIVDEKVKELTLTQEWIPVSERLPEEDQRVFVTQILGERTTVYCTRFPFEEIKEKYITAWMPLPEPYQVESEDKG